MLDPHAGQRVLTSGPPLGEASAVVIMLHGRGATPEDILSLGRVLARPDLTYLAPAAANQTWYPFSFLTDLAKNEPYLSSALTLVQRLVTRTIEKGVLRERIVLLGFSQGACLCSEFAVRHAARYGGVVALSGGLIGPPGTEWQYPGSLASTPVFLGCSDIDAHIPASRVNESAEVFERMGAAVTKRLYPGMGHTVNDDELNEARKILDALG